MTMTNEELKEILDSHKKWLGSEPYAEKADLRFADLRDADLSGANLWILSGDAEVWAIVRAELEKRIANDLMRQKHEND